MPDSSLRRLPRVSITAVSYLNATGRGRMLPGEEAALSVRWEASGLSPLPHCASTWGRVQEPLAPLPPDLGTLESRCARLLAECLQPLVAPVRNLCARLSPERIGVVLGSSTGGIDATEEALSAELQLGRRPPEYQFTEAHPYGALLRVVRGLTAARGPMYVISTACSSGGKALAAAQRLLVSGVVDAVLTGGVDALTGLTVGGFNALHLVSASSCAPFAKDRDGISLGEGAALFLLERSDQGRFCLLGAGESSDAYHATAPHPEGLGARLALRRCLASAGLRPGDVAYLLAHGTGTPQNDAAEARAIHHELGPVAFSSTKDRTGHQLGAAAATSALFALDALLRARAHGALEDRSVDETLPVQPISGVHALDLSAANRVVLVNAFAFGGNNVTLALGRSTAAPAAEAQPPAPLIGRAFGLRAASSWVGPGAVPERGILGKRTWGRASPLTRIFAWLLADLSGQTGVPPDQLAALPLFLGSGYGELSTSLSLLHQLTRGEPLSPAKFAGSVHSTAAGLLTIASGSHEPSSAVSAGADTTAMTLLEALAWLTCHGGSAVVLLADEDGPAELLGDGAFPAQGAGFLLQADPMGSNWALRFLPGPGPDPGPGPNLGQQAGPPQGPIEPALRLAAAVRDPIAGALAIGPSGLVELNPQGSWVLD